MAIRAKWDPAGFYYFDDVTGERVGPQAAHFFEDDFDSAGWAAAVPTAKAFGATWIKKIVGAGPPTVAGVANTGGGVASLALAATSEKEDAVLYFGDQLTWDATKLLRVEARTQLGVIPTAGTQVVVGVMSSWIDGPDNNTYYARFGLRANGALLCELQDGVNQVSVSAGITIATTTEWHDLLIDLANTGAVRFLVDGNVVAASTSFAFAATGANAILQPYAAVYKASGTGVGTLNLDFMRLWSGR